MEQPAEKSPNAAPVRMWRKVGVWWLVLLGIGAAIVIALAYGAFSRASPICIAAANSLTGPSSPAGTESLAATEIAIDEVNRKGGVDGRRIELAMFDDESTAEGARANVKAIAESRCVAVLGHNLNTASFAAGPLYKANRIPALTGTSFVDELTTDNPYYFRAQTTASMQGRSTAEYLNVMQGSPQVELVHSDDRFGRSYRRGFTNAYGGGRLRSWTFDPGAGVRAASAHDIAVALTTAPNRGIIVIGTAADDIPDVVMAIRRRGLTDNLVAAGGAGSVEFLQRFANEPEEKRQPGFFSTNLYATPPLIFDSAGAEAQFLFSRYRLKTHRIPSWNAASSYDATRIMVEALRRAHVRNRPDTLQEDRERVRAALLSIDSPNSGVPGLTRSLYFDSQRNMPGAARMGLFAFGRFVTAPRQLVQVEHPEALDLADEQRQGHIVKIEGKYYWLQQVVYTGIEFNRLNRIEVRDGTFNVDLNLWMRFSGEDAPTRIEFPDLLDRDSFDPKRPTRAKKILVPAGLNTPIGWKGPEYNYRFYRISGDFKANYDLHEYPFDEQQLLIRFQNQEYRSELVTYVIDSFALRIPDNEQLVPSDRTPFSGLQQWRLASLRYFVDSISTASSLGEITRVLSSDVIKFAGFNVAIVLERNYTIYLIKALIPLILLIMVVFSTLFMPQNLYRERITLPVTAILTSAVLLLAISSQIGDVGYTVAIEYIFYTFFFLCLGTMMIGISHDALVTTGRPKRALLLARTGQILYVITVLLMMFFFWWRYGRN